MPLDSAQTANYTRPLLYPKQLAAMFHDKRWGLIEATTKSGKTVSAMSWIIEEALKGQAGWNYWWVAPGYNQADIAYRRLKAGLTHGSFVAYGSPTPRIELLNGAVIWFKSGDNPDALYGEDVYAAVIDEASRVSEESWHALRSTVTATRGPCRIIGNVKGRKNWFYQMARVAESGDRGNMHYAKITAYDAIAAGVLDNDEVEDARATLPENVFKELYLAEPADDTGNPFGLNHIQACAVDGLATGPVAAWGIDLAKHQDFFVCIGLNEKGQVCAFERWRGVPWRVSIQRVWKLVGEDTPALVDSTGVGDPVLEELQHEHSNFIGFGFTPTSKQKLMEGLAVSIQSHEVEFPNGVIKNELDSFEYAYTKTGVRYSAPEGMHDDCVCALALARQMWSETGAGENVMKFYAQATKAQRTNQESEISDADNPRPWREGKVQEITAADILDNELTALYKDTAIKIYGNDVSRDCAYCHETVSGPQRVTDGAHIWHVDCARGGVRPKAA